MAVILRNLVVRVFRFVHLFSGHLREADLEDWLSAYFADAGYMIEVVNVDVGFLGDHNLADEVVGAEWRRRAAAGEFDGGHAGPPCGTWSRVRFRTGGPPPLRLRTHPWGRPRLTAGQLEKVGEANRMMRTAMGILKEVIMYGGSGTLEHPADPGRAPFPSIWNTDEMRNWIGDLGLETVTFPQCMMGAAAKKETTIAGRASDLEGHLQARCGHAYHSATLSGKDETGKFRTKVSQAYPPELCRRLALAHRDYIVARKEGEERQLSEREAEEALQEWVARRSSAAELLPKSFAEALG